MYKPKLGQHFLKDLSVANEILESLDIQSSDFIVEIGAGTGVMTPIIAKKAYKVLAIEIDSNLVKYLKRRFVQFKNLTLLEADARELDFSSLVIDKSSDYKCVGNLPYYAAARIVRRILGSTVPPKIIVAMLQKEVAENMAAEPGKMRFQSLLVQSVAKVELLFHVKPNSFSPPPKVTSSVVRITPFTKPKIDFLKLPITLKISKAAFNASRKTLHNSLSAGTQTEKKSVEKVLSTAKIDPTRRPATLSVEEWLTLSKVWESQLTK